MKFEKSSLPDATVEALEFPVALIRPYYQVSIFFFSQKKGGSVSPGFYPFGVQDEACDG